MKKKTSSSGMDKTVGPIMTLGGYVHILRRMRWESHGIVAITAIEIKKRTLYKSSRVQTGRKRKVKTIAGGMVYFRCLYVGWVSPFRLLDQKAQLTQAHNRSPSRKIERGIIRGISQWQIAWSFLHTDPESALAINKYSNEGRILQEQRTKINLPRTKLSIRAYVTTRARG